MTRNRTWEPPVHNLVWPAHKSKQTNKQTKKSQRSRESVFFQWFVCHVGWKVGSLKWRMRSHVSKKKVLLCFWAYASCHVTCVQQTMNCEPLQASALSFPFWKWGICGDTHPHSRATINASTGTYLTCFFNRCETILCHKHRLTFWRSIAITSFCFSLCFDEPLFSKVLLIHILESAYCEIDLLYSIAFSSSTGSNKHVHFPVCKRWCIFQFWPDSLANACSYVTWQAGARKGTWQTFTQHGSCFCKHKNSLRPQANNSLSCSWNNSYCAFWAYASCHVTCVQQNHELWTLASKRTLFSFLKMGNLRWYSSPQPGMTTTAGSLVQRLPNFPRVHSDPFRSFKNCPYLSWQNVWGVALTIHKEISNSSSTSKRHWSCHRCHGWLSRGRVGSETENLRAQSINGAVPVHSTIVMGVPARSFGMTCKVAVN